MRRIKLFFCLALFLIFFISCTADKQRGVQASGDSGLKAAQGQSESSTNQNKLAGNKKSLIFVQSTWGDIICLNGCVGIFTGENRSNLMYSTVADRIEKHLGIKIKKMNFDEISEESRSKLLSNGVQSISIQRSSLLRNAIGFYKTVGSEKIFLVKASKLYKTNWVGRAQLWEEKLDVEFLVSGQVCNAMFDLTYAGKNTPSTKWIIVDENRKEVDRYRNEQLYRDINRLIGYLCGQQALKYLLPASYCRK